MPRVDAIGVPIEVTVNEDGSPADWLDDADSLTMLIRKPNGTLLTKAVTIPSAGVVRYVTISGDLNGIGKYRVQIAFVIDGLTDRTTIAEFDVLPNV